MTDVDSALGVGDFAMASVAAAILVAEGPGLDCLEDPEEGCNMGIRPRSNERLSSSEFCVWA